ncbi:DUF6573 family protein [Paenibacillus ihuae]|uniref:DUF6573 family protein n=1 Tax=Paenibacillus ihuae TaxID=1232431 RepID=UPI0006D59E0D|nr:DUF6573 family protein [Paenibacillus ihuae]
MDDIQNDKLLSQYSRAEAIGDGLLVDITTWTKRGGITYPVALSRSVWLEIIEPDESAKAACESLMGRLGRFVLSLRNEMIKGEGDRIDFQVTFSVDGHPKDFSLYAMLHPGDNFEPVITVMEQDEE